MRVEDLSFQKDETGASYIVYAEGITKWPTPKKLAIITKKVWNTVLKVVCKTISKVFSKHPFGMEKSGPFVLQPIVNPLTNIWYQKKPMGINSINSML